RTVLAIRAPGDDRRHRPLVGGPIDIDVDLHAVPQRHREIALYNHCVFILECAAVGRRLAAALFRRVARAAVAILEIALRHIGVLSKNVSAAPQDLNFLASASAVRASSTVSVPTATNV